MKSKYGIALLIMGVGIALLPLVMSSHIMDPVLIPRFTLLGGVTFLAAAILSFNKDESQGALHFLRSRLAWPYYLFLLSGIGASLLAINRAEAIFFIGKDVLFFILLFILIQVISDSAERVRWLIICVVISAFIVAGFGMAQLFQVLQMEGAPDYYLVKSTLAHRNLHASSLVLFIPFLVFGVFRLRKFWQVLSVIVLLLSLVLIISLQSRTAWVALVVMMLVFGLLKLITNTSLQKVKLPVRTMGTGLVVFTLGTFLIFYTATPEVEPNAELRGGLGFTDQDEKTFTIDERVFLWKATGRMINDQSLAGVGPGNWKIWFPRYGSDIWRARQGMVQFQRPHNDYLWILAEQGIIGLLAYIFMGMVVLYCGIKLITSSVTNPQMKLLIMLLLSGFCAYAAMAFFSFPRERIVHQLIITLISAIILGLYIGLSVKADQEARGFTKAPLLLSIVVLPFLIFIGFQRWRGEVQTRKILAARTAAQWPVILAEYEPIRSYPSYNIDPTSVPIVFYSGLAHLNLDKNEEAKRDFRKAYELHPYNIHVVNNLANIYQLSGETAKAIEYYEKALEISPKYLDGALNLIAVYFNSNRVDEAYKLLKRYHVVFAGDGQGDARYQQYLLVVLHTMRDNLRDSQANNDIQKELGKLDDEQLLEIYNEALQSDESIYKLMLKRVKPML